jgi:hypothetical protein
MALTLMGVQEKWDGLDVQGVQVKLVSRKIVQEYVVAVLDIVVAIVVVELMTCMVVVVEWIRCMVVVGIDLIGDDHQCRFVMLIAFDESDVWKDVVVGHNENENRYVKLNW